MEDKLRNLGFVGRFKPLHNGGLVVLEELCKKADELLIGIGSCNKYNLRNPFTAEESAEMIDLALSQRFSNYRVIQIPDFAQIPEYRDGQKWKQYVLEKFGGLAYFVSSNEFVRALLQDSYKIIHPAELIPKEKLQKIKSTQVRVEMARFGNWKDLVPEKVAKYLEENGIVERFRKEFGLQTLALLSEYDDCNKESLEDEKNHPQEI